MAISLLKETVNTDDKLIYTLNQFVQNPTGKYSSYFSRRDKIKEDLEKRYNIVMKDTKKFKYSIYKDKEVYMFHFILPSEEFKDKLTYDVCIELTPSTEESLSSNRFSSYVLKLFSNSPNFMFTYTYVLNKKKMLIDYMKTKCSRVALTNAPSLKNPIESMGFEKSCYFCAMFIKNNLNDKKEISPMIKPLSKGSILSKINSQEQQMSKNTLLRKKIKDMERKSKSKTKSKPRK